MTARAETAEQRLAIYASLTARNRAVMLLRALVPLAGAVVLAIFVARIMLASLAGHFDIGQVHFAGDTVSIDTPSYSGTMSDGNVYRVSAESAHTSLGSLNVIDLTNPNIVLTATDGLVTNARAAQGSFDSLTQQLYVPGTADVAYSNGTKATISEVTVDLGKQTVASSAPVHVVMGDGTVIDGSRLEQDGKTGRWDFGRATLTLPGLPQATDEAAASSATPAGATPASKTPSQEAQP
ncbi:MAG TPA: LPS export ABC transporter periplasmic protein LptC [Devosia sp.]|nr:LPS export ABC transporter periplasmic protein LptC [Devosia sp.]